MRFIVRFTDDGATDVATTGGKGANLGLLTAARFRVPPGFTVTTNAYGKDKPRTYRVGPHRSATHSADPLATAGGWYDVTVTASGDASWSQRFVGHLENGESRITGV